MKGAVAVDLGATSARSALGWYEGGTLKWELIEQAPHAPCEVDGRLRWDLEALLGVCRRALHSGRERFEEVSFGIDSWGVDFAIVDDEGRPLEEPVCYRDPQHALDFEAHRDWREFLYAETGIQHQPFNTVYQLMSRPAGRIRFMPDLLGDLTFGSFSPGSELTIASTSQLLNLRGEWSAPIFERLGRPTPSEPLVLPGVIRARSGNAVWVTVAGHDTASAVVGLNPRPSEAFLNVGTWSLLGRVIDEPCLDDPLFTNERAAHGNVRYLANIPGFYVANRVHEELGLEMSVPEWLATAENRKPKTGNSFADLFEERFFNPTSMLDALAEGLERPKSPEDWASLALDSMLVAVYTALDRLEATGPISGLVLGGGGAPALARALSAKLPVRLGPREATLEGNLMVQLRRWLV